MSSAFYPFFVSDTPCELTDDKGYVLYSSLGSFYIPLAIIIFVYIKIWKNMRKRIRKRAEASGLALKKTNFEDEETAREETTTGIPSASKCKLTSVSLFLRRANGGTNSSCKNTKQCKINRNNNRRHRNHSCHPPVQDPQLC